jgi:predicted DsbA family dithiol-disulfide isomerase
VKGSISQVRPLSISEVETETFAAEGYVRQTVDAHRLLAQAHEKGGEKMQRALLERLFVGYFENAKDPGDREWLVEEGAAAGVGSREEVEAFLASSALRSHVQDEMAWASSKGIEGVPFVSAPFVAGTKLI